MKPLESIASVLRSARDRKGLSQGELGRRVGLPQSHISKIERAAVDLQTTSLIELARALDLELTLLPRSLLPTVQALQPRSAPKALRELANRPLSRLIKKARTLQGRFLQAKALTSLITLSDELRRMPLDAETAFEVRDLATKLAEVLDELRHLGGKLPSSDSEVLLDTVEVGAGKLRHLRNAYFHGAVEKVSQPIPAYSLDKDE